MTVGVVVNGHPLHHDAPEPHDLARCPWIDFDVITGNDGSVERASLVAILNGLPGLTDRPVPAAVLRASSASLTLLAPGPCFAWLPLVLLDRLT